MCRESLINFNKYKITEDGKIYSKYKKDYMYGVVQSNDYLMISLMCTDGKQRKYLFHRVIYFYFNGDIPEGLQVNHIDEDKSNNALGNLNLLTPRENSNWGTAIQRSREKRTNDPNLSKPVGQIDLATDEIIAIFPSIHEVQRQLGFSHCNISKCCNGGFYRKGKWVNVYQAYNYGWRYI